VHKDWLCLEFAPDVLFAQKKLVCDRSRSHRILCEIQISNLNTHKLWVKGMWRKRTKI